MLSLSKTWCQFRKSIASRPASKRRQKQRQIASGRRSPMFEALEDRMLMTTIFSDGFEGAFPGSWTVTSTGANTTARWGDNYAKAANGSWSAFCADNGSNSRTTYDNNLTTTMQRQGVSLVGYNTATLGFRMWAKTESGYDKFQVKVRDQSGAWTTVYTVSGDYSASGWQTKSIKLNSFAGQSNLIVSFGFTSDGSVVPSGTAGVWLDDVALTAQLTDDAYEDNDNKAITDARPEGAGNSPNLGMLGSPRVINNLAMADSTDLYRFRMNATGTAADFTRIDFTHSQGDLDMGLYNASGTLIRSSTSVSNREQISLNGLAAGAYYVKVFGYQGVTNPNYTLTIDPAVALPKNYAVLFAGGIDAANNHLRYYDNIRNLYTTITTQCNVRPENVYVIFADGTNPAVDRSDRQNSDMSYASSAHVLSATRSNLFNTLTTLAGTVTSQDNFFFYSYDHGNGSLAAPATTGEEVLCGWGEDIGDHELAPRLQSIQAAHSTYVFVECFGGGMLDDLRPVGSNNFGCANTNHYEVGHSDVGVGFSAEIVNALNAGYRNTADVYEYARSHDPYLASGSYPANGGTYTSGKEHPWSTGSNFPIFIATNRAASTMLVPAGLPAAAVPDFALQTMASAAAAADGSLHLGATELGSAVASWQAAQQTSARRIEAACDAALQELTAAQTARNDMAVIGTAATVSRGRQTAPAPLRPMESQSTDLIMEALGQRDLGCDIEEPWIGVNTRLG